MNMEDFKARFEHESMKRSVAAALYAEALALSTLSSRETAEDDDVDAEAFLLASHGILTEAMKMLGFYGDTKLCKQGKINKQDQKQMIGLAEEIKQFLTKLEDMPGLFSGGA